MSCLLICILKTIQPTRLFRSIPQLRSFRVQHQKTLQELKVIDPENPDDQNMESWSFNKGPFLKQFKSNDNNEQIDVVSLSDEVVENHI